MVIDVFLRETICELCGQTAHTHGRQRKFRGEEGGPKGRNFRWGGGGSGFSRFFSVSPSKTGELSKTNNRTAEQALSHLLLTIF